MSLPLGRHTPLGNPANADESQHSYRSARQGLPHQNIEGKCLQKPPARKTHAVLRVHEVIFNHLGLPGGAPQRWLQPNCPSHDQDGRAVPPSKSAPVRCFQRSFPRRSSFQGVVDNHRINQGSSDARPRSNVSGLLVFLPTKSVPATTPPKCKAAPKFETRWHHFTWSGVLGSHFAASSSVAIRAAVPASGNAMVSHCRRFMWRGLSDRFLISPDVFQKLFGANP